MCTRIHAPTLGLYAGGLGTARKRRRPRHLGGFLGMVALDKPGRVRGPMWTANTIAQIYHDKTIHVRAYVLQFAVCVPVCVCMCVCTRVCTGAHVDGQVYRTRILQLNHPCACVLAAHFCVRVRVCVCVCVCQGWSICVFQIIHELRFFKIICRTVKHQFAVFKTLPKNHGHSAGTPLLMCLSCSVLAPSSGLTPAPKAAPLCYVTSLMVKDEGGRGGGKVNQRQLAPPPPRLSQANVRLTSLAYFKFYRTIRAS